MNINVDNIFNKYVNMIFGDKLTLLNILIFIALGFIIASMTICSCTKFTAGQAMKVIEDKSKKIKKAVLN
jgi:hypothetical protein